MSDDDDDYEVGYGKPPKHTQFPKGQSGNASGKRKPLNPGDVIIKALSSKHSIVGKSGKLTALEIIVEQLKIKAMKGDLPAIKVLLAEVTLAAKQSPQDEPAMTDHQLELIEKLLKAAKGGGGG